MHVTFFDLDHTLLAGDSDYLWGRFLVDQGVVDGERYAQANERFHAQYQAGELDIHAFQRFVLTPLLEQPLEHMQALRARYVDECIRPIVARHTTALIDFHRARGDAMAIITATNRFITKPIAELLGIDRLIATEPEIVDGRYTGKIAGTPCFQDGKIARAQEWLDSGNGVIEHTTVYSDSHNDLPLLRWANTAVAVDPDATLAAAATAAGWPVISLRGEAAPAYPLGASRASSQSAR